MIFKKTIFVFFILSISVFGCLDEKKDSDSDDISIDDINISEETKSIFEHKYGFTYIDCIGVTDLETFLEKAPEDELLQVTDLFFENASFSEFTGLYLMPNLKSIELLDGYITTLRGIEELEYLEEINLCGNDITNLEGLDNLPKLKLLMLERNKIISMKGVSDFSNLENLDLNYNSISVIEDIEQLENLQTLSLYFNPLTDISALSGMQGMKNLELNLPEGMSYSSEQIELLNELKENNDYVSW